MIEPEELDEQHILLHSSVLSNICSFIRNLLIINKFRKLTNAIQTDVDKA
jgi:hypothetical protein